MMEMTEQTISDQTINKLDQQMDDTEEGEILEDGEIADEDETISSSGDHHKTEEKEIKNSSNYRENDCYNNKDNNRDSRRRDSENRKSEDRNRDKDKTNDKDRRSDRDRDRDRRDRHERNDRSERDRKSSSTDRERRDTDRDRKTSSVVTNSDDERRRKERDRKRRRSDEEDRDERQKETEKRKRNRDQNWSEYNNSNNESNNNNNRNNNNFDDFERRPFEDFDFRIPEPHGFSINNTNMGPMRERDLNNDDNEDLNFDERDFEEMLQIMEHRMPSNRVGAMDAIEKKEMMRAMAVMMRRNIDSDKGKRLARLRERRRINERQPGPTGTRAVLQRAQADSQQRPAPFKQICKYFLEGKCHKGADCPFSHDAMPPKKKELCKFYLQGFCGKGEDCLFMHSEFPCKFFHTNVECYSGDNCRFSHCPLTEETREILRNYLDSGTLPDDPKPERQHRQHSNADNNNTDNNNKSNSYKESQNQNNSQTISDNSSAMPSMSSGTGYTPVKPIVKRHAILGDPTLDMKNSHQTWIWQQEMKELEVAYVGNKRNLFCIEKPFVMNEKPATPRMEDDEEEIEAQIRNYYKDTMPELAEADTDHRQQQQKPSSPVEVVVAQPVFNDEQKLIEASAHDEDLRTLLMRPRSHTNESMNTEINNDIDERLQTSSMVNVIEESQSKPQSLQEVPQNVPKVARDLYLKMQNKLQNENEIKSNDWQSDSDDDDKNVMAAALKNVQQSSKQSSPSDKISKMLSIIRNSSNTSANQSPQQSEFWQNIMSGIHMSAGGSPSAGGNSTPPRTDYRDPRLKRSGKESMSPTIVENTSPAVKICDPNVKIEYKLLPIRAADIDYSTYVSIYRIDARLKNDPRLQKFFSRLPSSEIDNLSRIVPPPLKMAPVTPLSVLKSKKKSDKEHQKDINNKRERTPKANSPTLPPLPPLTISPSKPVTTPGIFPPTPPPIMSPLELISSRPTYTVSADTKSYSKIEVKNENTVIISKTDGNKQTIDSINDIKPEPILSPPPPLLLKNTPLHSLTSSPENIEPIIKTENESPIEAQMISNLSENNYSDSTVDPLVKSAANNVSTDEQVVIKPVLSSLPLISSNCMPSPQTSSSSLTTELFETALNTSINSDIIRKRDDLKIDEQMETSSNFSTEDDLYDNLYPSQTIADDLSTAVSVTELQLDSQKPMSSSSSPRSSIDEFELIRNELKGPTLSIDSDNELEIDLRQRKDSVSEVESADECELMIASASETEDNNESDVTNSSNNNIANDLQNNENNVSFDEPMNLSVSDVQNSGSDGNQTSDQSLKSVFSTIDPTASPFC